MNLQHFLEGYFIGVSVGITIGFSGILCLQNMMTGQLSLGVASILGVALSNMICAIIALLGLEFLQTFLMPYKMGLTIATGIFLCGIGLKRIFGKVYFDVQYAPSAHVLRHLVEFFLGFNRSYCYIGFFSAFIGINA